MNPNRRIDGKNNILQIMLSRPTVGRIRIGTESSTLEDILGSCRLQI